MKPKHPIDQKRLQWHTTSANITFRGSNTAANYLFAEALAEAFHTNFVNFTKMGLQNCIKNQWFNRNRNRNLVSVFIWFHFISRHSVHFSSFGFHFTSFHFIFILIFISFSLSFSIWFHMWFHFVSFRLEGCREPCNDSTPEELSGSLGFIFFSIFLQTHRGSDAEAIRKLRGSRNLNFPIGPAGRRISEVPSNFSGSKVTAD